MRAADLVAVSEIAAALHPDHFERDEVFAERLALDPDGCRVLADGDDVAGYVLSHPWLALTPPALDNLLGSLPARPTTYYIHDIAMRPGAQGRGAGRTILDTVEARAQALGLPTLSLVTVAEAATFWRAAGFAETPVEAAAREALRSYGEGAFFMTRGVPHTRG